MSDTQQNRATMGLSQSMVYRKSVDRALSDWLRWLSTPGLQKT